MTGGNIVRSALFVAWSARGCKKVNLCVMFGLLRFFFRWGVLIALLPGAYSLWMVLLAAVPQAFDNAKLGVTIVMIVGGWGMHRFLRRGDGRLADFISFLDTLEHELTHGLVGLLFLRPPSALHVTGREGGHIRLKGSNWLISLAPYLLPLGAVTAALLKLIVNEKHAGIVLMIALFLYGVFISRLMSELHPNQTDLTENGLLHSYLVVILFHLLLLPTVIFLASGVVEWNDYFLSFFDDYPRVFEMVKGWISSM